jgi:hypothetical protein
MRTTSSHDPARRRVLRGAAAAAVSAAVSASAPRLAAQTAEAIAAALPLVTTGLEHLGTLVPDVAAAGRFYASVFNPDLHKEREGVLRYDVPFGVGYLAIGAAGERPTQIDHYCALVEDYDRAAMAARLEAERFAAGRFGMIRTRTAFSCSFSGCRAGSRRRPSPPAASPMASRSSGRAGSST